MGLPSMGGAPRPNGGAPAPQGAPPMAGAGGPPSGGGGNIKADLMALHATLPPDAQHLLDPNNPITALTFKRLRDDLSDEEGQALLMLFGNADALAIAAAKKVWPEIMLLLDIFDDGEVNNSIGEGGGTGTPMGFDGAPGAAVGGAPAPRPPMAPPEEEEEYEEEAAPPRSRLGSIMG